MSNFNHFPLEWMLSNANLKTYKIKKIENLQNKSINISVQ